MTGEVLVAIIVSGVGAVFTGIGVVIRALKTADTDRLSAVERRSAEQDSQIARLDEWKLAARFYIATLRGLLADRGIPSPEPPPELGIDTTRPGGEL